MLLFHVRMQDFRGLESFTPGEGAASASEQLSEAAKERFAQSQQQTKQSAKDEKKARKRDDKVAETIRQFMADEKYSHLFQLMSRLSARDCPSIFILAILSLMHEESLVTVEEYIAEQKMMIVKPDVSTLGAHEQKLPLELQEKLLLWSSRLELVLSKDAERILSRLMVDQQNIDGTVLQFTTFVLVDFFELVDLPIPYDDLQPLTIKILQNLLEPHMEMMEKHFQKIKKEANPSEDDE